MRTGRPRSFDRDQVLEKAMHLFWQRGYEGTTLGQLTAAMGIAAPSLYAAFGSKEGLYREALDRYSSLPALFDLRVIDRSGNLQDVMSVLLYQALDLMIGSEGRGCMITTGMVSGLAEHASVARDLKTRRENFRAELMERFSSFLPSRQAAAHAAYLMAILQGLSTQARDGATAEQLRDIVGMAVQQIAITACGISRTEGRRGASRP